MKPVFMCLLKHQVLDTFGIIIVGAMAATSAAAYNLAKKLCQEYEKRKKAQ